MLDSVSLAEIYLGGIDCETCGFSWDNISVSWDPEEDSWDVTVMLGCTGGGRFEGSPQDVIDYIESNWGHIRRDGLLDDQYVNAWDAGLAKLKQLADAPRDHWEWKLPETFRANEYQDPAVSVARIGDIWVADIVEEVTISSEEATFDKVRDFLQENIDSTMLSMEKQAAILATLNAARKG